MKFFRKAGEIVGKGKRYVDKQIDDRRKKFETIINAINEENKYLREELVEEKVKSDGNISALNKALEEAKQDNNKLSRQIEDYLDLKEHYSNLRKQGII